MRSLFLYQSGSVQSTASLSLGSGCDDKVPLSQGYPKVLGEQQMLRHCRLPWLNVSFLGLCQEKWNPSLTGKQICKLGVISISYHGECKEIYFKGTSFPGMDQSSLRVRTSEDIEQLESITHLLKCFGIHGTCLGHAVCRFPGDSRTHKPRLCFGQLLWNNVLQLYRHHLGCLGDVFLRMKTKQAHTHTPYTPYIPYTHNTHLHIHTYDTTQISYLKEKPRRMMCDRVQYVSSVHTWVLCVASQSLQSHSCAGM